MNIRFESTRAGAGPHQRMRIVHGEKSRSSCFSSAADEERYAHADPRAARPHRQRDLVIEVESSAEKDRGIDPDVSSKEPVGMDDAAELRKYAPLARQEEVPLQRDGRPELEITRAVITAAVGVDAERDRDRVVDALDEHRIGQLDRSAKAATEFCVAIRATVNTSTPSRTVEDHVEVRFELGRVVRMRARTLDDPVDRQSFGC